MDGIKFCPHRSTEGHGPSKARIGVRIPMGVQKFKIKVDLLLVFIVVFLLVFIAKNI